MGPSCHFYSCIGLITGILHVDRLSMRHPGNWGVTYTRLYLLRNKDEATDIFIKYKNEVENQHFPL